MPSVELLFPFLAREFHLFGIDDYHMIRHVVVWNIGRLVFAFENSGNLLR